MTDAQDSIRARLEAAANDLVITQRAWADTISAPALERQQQNLIDLLREASSAFAAERAARETAERMLADEVAERDRLRGQIEVAEQRFVLLKKLYVASKATQESAEHDTKEAEASLVAAEQAEQEAKQAYNICELHQSDKWEGDGTCVICEGNSLQSRLDNAEAVLRRLHTYFSDPRHERPEFKRLIETVVKPVESIKTERSYPECGHKTPMPNCGACYVFRWFPGI